MKIKSFLLALFAQLIVNTTLAYEVDGIYYNLNGTNKTAEVTYKDYKKPSYSGDLVIPEFIKYNGDNYSVTSIGDYAFYSCSGLTSVTIPNSVTKIDYLAFYHCSGLTTVTIPNSVVSIDFGAFYGTAWYNNQPDGLVYAGNIAYDYKGDMPSGTSVVIKDGTVSISPYAFYDCRGLTSIIIPNSVTSIGDYAFKGCTGLTSITIPNSVTSIGYSAFSGCTGLTSITIPNSVTSIERYTFENCSGLTSITIPNSVTSIGHSAFKGIFNSSIFLPDSLSYVSATFEKSVSLYVNKGTISLLSLWSAGYIPYNKETGKKLYKPTLIVAERTQTTITAEIDNLYEEYGYKVYCGHYIPLINNKATIINLFPEVSYSFYLYATLDDTTVDIGYSDLSTASISPVIKATPTASSLAIRGSYTTGDAIVTNQQVTIEYQIGSTNTNEKADGNSVLFSGLVPDNEYKAKYLITVKNSTTGTETKTYTAESTFKTEELSLTTLQPKVISVGNVIVAATSNLDDEETNVGFEWRRTDWSNDFASNTGGAYIYDGMMEGYIRNLNAEKLWKFRPYYEAASGKKFYGEWVGLDPTNTSYFEPTVHTYAKISVEGNSAQVKGYVMRGSDNVTQQGFMYWKQTNEARGVGEKAPSVPTDAQIVEATGNVMTANLKDLDYESTYCCVAFVKTSENELFYGELQTFQTGIDVSGVEEIEASPKEVSEVARYDIKGRRLDTPQRGMNIIRMSDGTVRKVMVR